MANAGNPGSPDDFDGVRFSAYVPGGTAQAGGAGTGSGGTPTQSLETYFRLGGANTQVETGLLTRLRAQYQDAASQVGVRAAFGGDGGRAPTAGAVLYTAGDLLQFVNGRAETEVLNDAFVVHVLNKRDVDGHTGDTSRAYLRLGKVDPNIESAFSGSLNGAFTLGYGAALYADGPLTLSTPDAYKVSVGSDERSVMGPSYSEIYSVSDSDRDAVAEGTLNDSRKLSGKTLISAELVRRALDGGWRTTSYSTAKGLDYTMADSGSFSFSSSYEFGLGLSFSNGLAGSFEAQAGITVSVPASWEVELTAAEGMKLNYLGGEIDYDTEREISGNTINLKIDPATGAGFRATQKVLSTVVFTAVQAINVAALAYTTAVALYGNLTTQDSHDPTGANIKKVLESGETVYVVATALNAVFMAAGLILSVIGLVLEKTASAANSASPAQLPNLEMNTAGIKLQAAGSYIEINAAGVTLFGPQLFLVGPQQTTLPASTPGNATPTGAAQTASTAASAATAAASGP